MSRYVAVRYLVPVYATVDLDAEKTGGEWPDAAIVKVFEADESITILSDEGAMKKLIAGDVLDISFEGHEDGEDVDPRSLSPEDRAKAIDIAENTVWPAWERG